MATRVPPPVPPPRTQRKNTNDKDQARDHRKVKDKRPIMPPKLPKRRQTKEEEEEEEEEEDNYETLVLDEATKRRLEKRTDLNSPAGGLITSAEILTSNSDHFGWLWRKENMFGSRKRYWGVLYHGALYLYENAKAFKEEDKIELKGATLKQHNNTHVFLLESERIAKGKLNFQAMDIEKAVEWVEKLKLCVC